MRVRYRQDHSHFCFVFLPCSIFFSISSRFDFSIYYIVILELCFCCLYHNNSGHYPGLMPVSIPSVPYERNAPLLLCAAVVRLLKVKALTISPFVVHFAGTLHPQSKRCCLLGNNLYRGENPDWTGTWNYLQVTPFSTRVQRLSRERPEALTQEENGLSYGQRTVTTSGRIV